MDEDGGAVAPVSNDMGGGVQTATTFDASSSNTDSSTPKESSPYLRPDGISRSDLSQHDFFKQQTQEQNARTRHASDEWRNSMREQDDRRRNAAASHGASQYAAANRSAGDSTFAEGGSDNRQSEIKAPALKDAYGNVEHEATSKKQKEDLKSAAAAGDVGKVRDIPPQGSDSNGRSGSSNGSQLVKELSKAIQTHQSIYGTNGKGGLQQQVDQSRKEYNANLKEHLANQSELDRVDKFKYAKQSGEIPKEQAAFKNASNELDAAEKKMHAFQKDKELSTKELEASKNGFNEMDHELSKAKADLQKDPSNVHKQVRANRFEVYRHDAEKKLQARTEKVQSLSEAEPALNEELRSAKDQYVSTKNVLDDLNGKTLDEIRNKVAASEKKLADSYARVHSLTDQLQAARTRLNESNRVLAEFKDELDRLALVGY